MTAPNTSVAKPLTKRQRFELLRNQLTTERASFISHWRELNDYILPRRGRFMSSDVNKGDRRTNKIIDSTATFSARTLSSGMMSGVTSPARPWFRLTTPDPDIAENPAVKEWLHVVGQRMATVLLRSNAYNALPILYADMGTFATGAMAMLEDDEDVIRCQTFPIGSYMIANDAKLRVRVFVREFRMTVRQVVELWGKEDWSNVSPTVRQQFENGQTEVWVDIVHVIAPNRDYAPDKIESKHKKFASCYYEAKSVVNDVFLAEEGFDEFPIMAARWDVTGEDAYGTNCPGMTALGDIKQLQTGEKRSAQAIEKMVNPPMQGPTSMRNSKASTIPGDMTYVDVREQQAGFRPVYEVKFDVDKLEMKQQQVRLRVQRAFYEDLFLMLAQSDRREITAREIDERHEEKLLALGPVLEQLNQDVLNPFIDRLFAIMHRKGLIPEAPPELEGVALRVEYISIMAQAQKMVGLASLERFAGFAGQVAQFDPSILDKIDGDELVNDYADATGVPPKILRSDDDVQQLRTQRAKQQAQATAAENAPKVAGAVRDLSQAPTDGNSALAALVGKIAARRTVDATAQPAQAVA